MARLGLSQRVVPSLTEPRNLLPEFMPDALLVGQQVAITDKAVSGSIASAGALSKSVRDNTAGAMTPAGAVGKVIAKSLGGEFT